MTTSSAMKYLLVEINEQNGEKEYTFKCLAQCSSEQNNDLVADAIALNLYEDDFDQHPFNRRYFWFNSWSIAVKIGNIYELPLKHYDVFRLYLCNLTPSDTAITEAMVASRWRSMVVEQTAEGVASRREGITYKILQGHELSDAVAQTKSTYRYPQDLIVCCAHFWLLFLEIYQSQ